MKNLLKIIFTLLLLQVSLQAKYLTYRYSGESTAATLNQLVSALSDQLTQNKNFINIQDSSIAITSFVCLENFQANSRLSNILSENLIHEMQVRGYKIIDFKTMGNIQINRDGDFLFSRDITKLTKELSVAYALTGTYTRYKDGTVVNARIIDLQTHVVLSSAQIFIPRKVVKRLENFEHRIVNFIPHKILLSKKRL